MPSPSASERRRSTARAPAPPMPAAQWMLLVRLPGRVVIAATSAEHDSPGRTVAEGLAGLAAIAAGRASDSDLVRAVVSEVYAETDGDGPDAEEFTDREAGLAAVLSAAREAARVLAEHADPADSAAYRQWIQAIAAKVCAASRSGHFAGPKISPDERRFLTGLGAALGLV
ncbi:hypothetical protein ACIA8K_13515 [Catenuloplanes sp. NPDC051500]|uniref:hypothetical protein n=1 Tax=Catenuloplanes sp. NPDC051500 TaxID=3363959 RepID=UPI0037ABAA44